MKVIFRANNRFGKKNVSSNIDLWIKPLEKYLTDEAVVRLSLFINDNNIAKASLNIVDKNLHVFASHADANFSVALDSVVEKCSKQIISSQTFNFCRETIRYTNDYNTSFEILDNSEINYNMQDAFDLIKVEQQLEDFKKTSRYNRTMNRYVNYLYRNNKIDQISEQLRILYLTLSSVDEEEMTVADYNRLCSSIILLEDELENLNRKQTTFENSVRDQEYINDIYEKEARFAKLKRIK